MVDSFLTPKTRTWVSRGSPSPLSPHTGQGHPCRTQTGQWQCQLRCHKPPASRQTARQETPPTGPKSWLLPDYSPDCPLTKPPKPFQPASPTVQGHLPRGASAFFVHILPAFPELSLCLGKSWEGEVVSGLGILGLESDGI